MAGERARHGTTQGTRFKERGGLPHLATNLREGFSAMER
jgi:hypothetical protein